MELSGVSLASERSTDSMDARQGSARGRDDGAGERQAGMGAFPRARSVRSQVPPMPPALRYAVVLAVVAGFALRTEPKPEPQLCFRWTDQCWC